MFDALFQVVMVLYRFAELADDDAATIQEAAERLPVIDRRVAGFQICGAYFAASVSWLFAHRKPLRFGLWYWPGRAGYQTHRPPPGCPRHADEHCQDGGCL